MAGTFTFIYLREEPLPVPGKYRARFAGARQGKGGWSVTRPPNCFLGEP